MGTDCTIWSWTSWPKLEISWI